MKIYSRLFLFIIFLLTGCWDAQELNEISLVTGLAIDKGKDYKYELTVEVLNPPALETETIGSQTASIIYTLEGDSVAELAKKTNVGFTRKLKYSHMRVVVISKELAEEGLLEFIDFFEADREIRNDFNFLVVNNVRASDVLKVTYPMQRVSSMKLHVQLDTMVNEWGGDPNIRLKDFVRALASPGREPVLGTIKVEGPVKKGNKLENMEKVEPDTLVVLDGLSIFKGLEYQGNLPVKHARNYLLLQDKLNNTSITVTCGENKMMTSRIYNSKTRINAYYKNDIPHIDVDIELEGRIDLLQCPVDIMKIKSYLEIEEKFAKSFKNEIDNTIRILQEEYQLDIFGFGEHMERQAYDDFKKVKDHWNEEFSRAEINVDVIVKLRRAGLITNPVFEDIE
ncbi:Ger(x)C family spore germination protein [Anaerobacillus isosaccharinicus]|uniref:Ger(X)C family spore germination protein n=1 Tax=Anaerobacillus isosaccharinicus TaxID=1532552 RepID=A0A1S2KUD3_9BACI|nr:Ger(x)C family spore germination protein [Anaerobacillus isosaccharinicus]MBA5585247.1 Ger(x)C family spore germination protein [Anaerobacillus isosaccharinicus]QOY36420.1 Ger(x)C family spore germination protein [Anaerobacillus isosaccharinicus]